VALKYGAGLAPAATGGETRIPVGTGECDGFHRPKLTPTATTIRAEIIGSDTWQKLGDISAAMLRRRFENREP
jgi:hypothetical protein